MRRLIGSFLAVLFFCEGWAFANDTGEWGRHSAEHKRGGAYSVDGRDREREREHEDGEEGNEATGQVAAWIPVLANLKVGVAVLARWLNRLSGSGSKVGRSATGVSRFLTKRLRKVHYVLNPIALATAFLHFLLSSCRSSPLPEWGLLMVTVMVLLGLMVKFKISFNWMRKFVYRVHTASVSFLLLIFVLLTDHFMID